MHLHRSWKTQGDAQEDHLHQGHYSQGRRRKQDQGRTEGRQEEMKCWPGATRVHNTSSTNLQENVNTSFNFTTLLYVYNTRFYFFSPKEARPRPHRRPTRRNEMLARGN